MRLSDQALEDDLSAIDKEVKRRKEARPFEFFAQWAMIEQTNAIARFHEREAIGASSPVAIETSP